MAFQILRESSLVKFHRAPFCLQTKKGSNASKPRKRLRGSYDSFTSEEKAKIAKKAIENGVTKTVVKYNRSYRIGH